MKVIALEEHIFPREVLDSAGLDLGLGRGPMVEALHEMGAGRIAVMDAAGVDVQVLSTVGHVVQGLEPERATAISRELNDRLALVVADHPERFKGFATLPMTDPAAAVVELRRTVEELGFVGAMIHGQTGGEFLDEDPSQPILELAQRLGVPIYLHPAPPPATVREAYYSRLNPAVGAMLATGGWGWHSECAMHVLRMVAGGVFDRLPDLQLIVGHMGEGIPFHLDRIEEKLTPFVKGHDLTVAETLRRNLHVTTAGYNTVTPLMCALMALGADRILFSVDHPFSDSERATAFLRDAPLSPHDRAKLAHTNAETLLGI